MRERQELHKNILSTSLLSLLFAFVPALFKCSNWSLLKCSGSIRAALPAASCNTVQQVVHYLLHYVAAWAALVWQLCCTTVLQCVFSICDLLHCVAAWAALVWQLCCMTVLQCVFSICDFIAVKCRPKKKKKEDRYFLVIAVIVFGLLDQF